MQAPIITAEGNFVVVAILVLIALAHLQVADQVLAGNSEPVSLERRYPAAGGQIFVHGRPGTEDSKRLGHHPVGEVHKGVF